MILEHLHQSDSDLTFAVNDRRIQIGLKSAPYKCIIYPGLNVFIDSGGADVNHDYVNDDYDSYRKIAKYAFSIIDEIPKWIQDERVNAATHGSLYNNISVINKRVYDYLVDCVRDIVECDAEFLSSIDKEYITLVFSNDNKIIIQHNIPRNYRIEIDKNLNAEMYIDGEVDEEDFAYRSLEGVLNKIQNHITFRLSNDDNDESKAELWEEYYNDVNLINDNKC